MASLRCAGLGALALWHRQHSSPSSPAPSPRARCCSIWSCSVSLARRRGNRSGGFFTKCRAWRAMASDSQAQDEEEEDDDVEFTQADGEDDYDDDDEEEDDGDDEDNIDVDVLSNEEIDALMKEYGNVVRSEPEKSSAADDANADAEALSMATDLAKVANEVKAVDIKLLHVKPLIYWARYFLLASAFSMPQVTAMVGRIEDIAQEKYGKTPRPSGKPSSWTLMDFGDVVVHIFLPSQREFYNLEEFYANAPVVDLPFVSESSSSNTMGPEAEEENEEEIVALS